jgi:hypothetical protein
MNDSVRVQFFQQFLIELASENRLDVSEPRAMSFLGVELGI